MVCEAVARPLQSLRTMGAPKSRKSRRILLVDDEEALVWSLASRLAKARPDYLVETAHDGETALAKLHARNPDLLVADVRMPGMSGIELIVEARKSLPALPAIMITAFKTPEALHLARSAATSFLEKPFVFEHLLRLLDAALTGPVSGFSGAISVQTLPDVVQLYLLSHTVGALRIRHAGEEGEIWFREGAIVHAALSSGEEGEAALYDIMVWSGGDFSMRMGATPPRVSITANPTELLIESFRLLDERRHDGAGKPSGTGWTIAPPDTPELAEDISAPPVSADSRSENDLTQYPPTEPPMNIKDSLSKLNIIDGFLGAALVDSESGMVLGQEGGGPLNLEIAAAGNTEVVKAKRKTMHNLGLKESIEDILITLTKQYHMIRPLRARPTIFFYVALDRQRANLAMARLSLAEVERDLEV